jgi:hypothetical protein
VLLAIIQRCLLLNLQIIAPVGMPATFASLRLLSIFSASDPGWRPPKAGGYFSSSSALGLDDQAVFLPELREMDVFR